MKTWIVTFSWPRKSYRLIGVFSPLLAPKTTIVPWGLTCEIAAARASPPIDSVIRSKRPDASHTVETTLPARSHRDEFLRVLPGGHGGDFGTAMRRELHLQPVDTAAGACDEYPAGQRVGSVRSAVSPI